MLLPRLMIWKNSRAAEEARERHVHSRRVRGARRQQVRRNDSQQRAQFENIPTVASEDPDRGVFAGDRVALPRQRLDERGFATAIRAQNAKALALFNPQ